MFSILLFLKNTAEVQLICSVILVSALQQSDSVIHIFFFHILFLMIYHSVCFLRFVCMCVWTIFKVFIEFGTALLLLFVFCFVLAVRLVGS